MKAHGKWRYPSSQKVGYKRRMAYASQQSHQYGVTHKTRSPAKKRDIALLKDMWRNQQNSERKPGLPPARSPEIKNTNKVTTSHNFFFRPSPLGFRQVDQHTSAWNELTLTIGPWYNSLHGASMDPTVKRLASGQASQSWIVVTVPKKQDTKERQEATTEKANKPNNKQNPQSAKQALWKGPAKLKKSDDLCITVENFITTGEGRLWESKFYIPFQPQKRASNKSNNLMTSSCASCGVVWSHEAGTLATLSPL